MTLPILSTLYHVDRWHSNNEVLYFVLLKFVSKITRSTLYFLVRVNGISSPTSPFLKFKECTVP